MFKIPTHEKLIKKLFKGDPRIENCEGYGIRIPIQESKEFISLTKGLFRCRGCGNCCRECNNIAMNRKDFEMICKHLNLSHKEIKNKYNFKFSKKEGREVRLMGQCAFFNKEKNNCDIYEARPTVCKQYPFSSGQLEFGEEFLDMKPVHFCYSQLLLIDAMSSKKTEEQKKFFEENKELFEGLREKITNSGLEKIRRDDHG